MFEPPRVYRSWPAVRRIVEPPLDEALEGPNFGDSLFVGIPRITWGHEIAARLGLQPPELH